MANWTIKSGTLDDSNMIEIGSFEDRKLIEFEKELNLAIENSDKLGLDIYEWQKKFLLIALKEYREFISHNTKVEIRELLEDYSNWLCKHNYTDCDIICEEPLAADEYLKENPPEKFIKINQ